MKRIEATLEILRIYAQDESETADVKTVEILKDFFAAVAAAMFFKSGRGEYLFSLAGTDLPIGIPRELWDECVGRFKGLVGATRFGPWATPGFGPTLESWIGAELYSGVGGVGYIVLGRSGSVWSEEEAHALSSFAITIAPIVGDRTERSRAEYYRGEIEASLAESEGRLRSFFEDSRDMIYTANADDIVSSVNAAGLALTGREKHEIIGHPFSSLALSPQDRESLIRRVTEEGYAADFEIVLARKDGSAVFCLETSHAFRGPDGAVVEIQGIVKDISQRIRDERELWKTNLELAEANLKLQQTQSQMVQQERLASIGQLAAGVAHEINNPLGYVKSNQTMIERHIATLKTAWETKVAKAGIPAAELREIDSIFSEFNELFSESAEGLARIMGIVSNLKSFSRVELEGDFELYDVNAGVESTLVVAWNEIKYVAETRKLLGELPKIRARGGEINQVILNLLVNAAQAIESQRRTEKGRIQIETKLNGDRVSIAISDDGPGIPEAIRTKVFDPFFTTKEPGKGTGLGLSISYDIVVAKHGGRLFVDSEVGKGSSFVIELPVSGSLT